MAEIFSLYRPGSIFEETIAQGGSGHHVFWEICGEDYRFPL